MKTDRNLKQPKYLEAFPELSVPSLGSGQLASKHVEESHKTLGNYSLHMQMMAGNGNQDPSVPVGSKRWTVIVILFL